MAGFNEFLGALRFGMGLVSGFTAQADKERQANEAKQLKLLQLLKDDEHELVELPYAQIQPSGNMLDALFGTGQARVGETGEPAIVIGNRGFVRRAYAPISIPKELLEPSKLATQPADVAPTSAPPVRPFAPQETPQVPEKTEGPPQVSREQRSADIQKYATLAAQIAEREGVPAQLIPVFVANIHVESQFNPQAESRKGAQGLGQLMPETAARYKVSDVFNPAENLRGSARYFRDLAVQFQNDPAKVVAAYNVGEGVVEQYGGVPPYRETQAHVKRVQELTEQYAQAIPKRDTRFAGPGATAPETEASAIVASRAALVLPTAPQFGEIQLPVARTLEDYTKQEQRRAYTTLAPTLRNTAKGREKLGVSLRDAETKAQTVYDRDFKTARTEADRIKRERQIHSYEVLNALDRVKDPEQLKVILDYAAKNTDPDHLGDSFQLLQQARPEERPALMARLYPQLLAANYTDQAVKLQWKPFYDEMENKQKVTLETALAPLREKASALQGSAGTEARIKAEQKARQDMTLREAVKDEATRFYDTTTGNRVNQILPYGEVQQQVKEGKVKELTQEQQKRYDGTQMVLPLIDAIKTRIEKIWGPGGIFENLQPGGDRYQAMVRGGLARFFQEDPELSILVRQIESNVDLVGRELQAQVGTQTELDALRRLKSFPQATGVPDSQAVAYGTFNELLEAMRGRLGKMLGNPNYQQEELKLLVTKKIGTTTSGVPAIPTGMQPGETTTLSDGTTIRRVK